MDFFSRPIHTIRFAVTTCKVCTISFEQPEASPLNVYSPSAILSTALACHKSGKSGSLRQNQHFTISTQLPVGSKIATLLHNCWLRFEILRLIFYPAEIHLKGSSLLRMLISSSRLKI